MLSARVSNATTYNSHKNPHPSGNKRLGWLGMARSNIFHMLNMQRNPIKVLKSTMQQHLFHLVPAYSRGLPRAIMGNKSTVVASSPVPWRVLGAIISGRSDGRHRQSWIPSARLRILGARVRACDVT